MRIEPPHSAWRALAVVARHHRRDLDAEGILHAVTGDRTAGTPEAMAAAAAGVGFEAEIRAVAAADLGAWAAGFPCLAFLANGQAVVLLRCRADGRVTIIDPLATTGAPLVIEGASFADHYGGTLLLLRPGAATDEAEAGFGLSWFLPAILRERALLTQVAMAALLLHLLGLAVPVYFQLIIDKVLVHAVSSTLAVLTIGVVGALLFEAFFTFIRRQLLIHATTRIDLRLSLKLFGHLVGLPLTFFDRLPTGILVKHLAQAEKIREFLTGRLFATLIDVTVLVVLLPLLFLYSFWLTLVVLGFAAAIGLVLFLVMPVFRARLSRLYAADGRRQALLVETIGGMATAKALALEPRLARDWSDLSAETAALRRGVASLSASVGVGTGLIEKLMQVAIIAIGALLVFDGGMSVGALVAFQMLAGRVLGPLSQLTGLISEFQETLLSVRMLGEVMNAPPERRAGQSGARPPMRGHIEFDAVTFRYPGVLRPALDRVSLSLPAGAVVGIVGRSGSGKTTLTRLIQGFHAAEEGVLRIDGVDVRAIDLAHLRQNIGTVLQENFLFRGTVRDNIAMTRPEAPVEDVIAAAELAGAADFIQRLPQGLDTVLEEGGSNLSGGQRQRIAIARALLRAPPILLFDEATSALDPESEASVRANMRRMAEGRSVLIVSHRLSTLADADLIVVIDDGRIVDVARHAVLLERCDIYRQLWQGQSA
ncbi:peptidase domain-containing ABC transporter [Zavarzinia compransoris]|uniref:Peptidase C39 n=1 Tax=Zavarzinia compransoris TaxID=1264899 RepID=A0A317DTC9_9PROT|nr:peptidase domain-containing ABC transporter [Zavarzinia compransoris]PWR17614.1 peptidase C39 [Zavarzinia compransoris]TDP44109.1 ATP-binding cassette subfamily B protein [Zavarzinia compransoris]